MREDRQVAIRPSSSMNPVTCEQLMRPRDVARTLNIGKRTFERWLASGRFPRPDIKVGPKILLWKPATVTAWVEQVSVANAKPR